MRFSQKLSVSVCASIVMAISVPASAKTDARCKTGTPAQNIALAKDFYKAYNTGDADLLGKTLSADYVSEPVAPGEAPGPAAAIARMKFVQATFSPTTIENVEFLTHGNKVVVRSNITSVHSGNFFGLAPTGRTLKFGAIDIHTICNGKIVLGHHEEGWLGVMLQLGILPVKN